MPRMVHCVKLGRELPGLDSPPWPGELGQRVYENVSAQGWDLWREHAKMLMNEYRLAPWQPEAQKFLNEQLEQFFFGPGSNLPPGFVAGP